MLCRAALRYDGRVKYREMRERLNALPEDQLDAEMIGARLGKL
jgi:hypothetical protein